MSFDADTKVPPLKSSKSHGYDKPSSHQKHLAEQCDDKRKKSDEKPKKKKHEYNQPSSAENGCENSRIYQRLSSAGKSLSSRSAGYDIPKDTINEAIIGNSDQCHHSSPSCSPSKRPLLPAHKFRSGTPRSPPPTIVLSPPEEHSAEKVKVIFEYDQERCKMKVADDEGTPNFLIRNKRTILICAFILLIFLLVSISIVIIYALNSEQ